MKTPHGQAPTGRPRERAIHTTSSTPATSARNRGGPNAASKRDSSAGLHEGPIPTSWLPLPARARAIKARRRERAPRDRSHLMFHRGSAPPPVIHRTRRSSVAHSSWLANRPVSSAPAWRHVSVHRLSPAHSACGAPPSVMSPNRSAAVGGWALRVIAANALRRYMSQRCSTLKRRRHRSRQCPLTPPRAGARARAQSGERPRVAVAPRVSQLDVRKHCDPHGGVLKLGRRPLVGATNTPGTRAGPRGGRPRAAYAKRSYAACALRHRAACALDREHPDRATTAVAAATGSNHPRLRPRARVHGGRERGVLCEEEERRPEREQAPAQGRTVRAARARHDGGESEHRWSTQGAAQGDPGVQARDPAFKRSHGRSITRA